MSHPEETEKPRTNPRRYRSWKRWALIAGIPLAAGLAFLPRVMAWGGGHHFGHHHAESADELRERAGQRADWVLDKLDATDEQRTQVQAIVDRTAPEAFELMTEGRQVRKALRAALLGEQVDEQAVQQARAELDSIADRGSELMLDTLAEVSRVLTPEQRAKIADHFDRFGRH